MTPAHATKPVPGSGGGRRRYRYYVTHPTALAESEASGWRIAAHDAERLRSSGSPPSLPIAGRSPTLPATRTPERWPARSAAPKSLASSSPVPTSGAR